MNEKGITLTALVITIIVLLILAGVSISVVLGDDGLIANAQKSAIREKLKEIQEKVEAEIYEEKLKAKNNNEEFDINRYKLLTDFNLDIESEYSEIIGVSNGKIYIKSEADENIKEIAKNNEISVGEKGTVNSNGNGVVVGSAESIKNYRIYGNSVQNGNPSPTSPMEIKNVGDKTKNLINKNSAQENKYINSSGIVSSSTGYGLTVTEKIFVKPSTTYIYSGMGNVQGTTVSRTGFQYDKDGNPIKVISSSNGSDVKFITEANCHYVILQYVKTETNPMLEKNTIKTDYEPYGYKIPITASGKNLMPVNDTSYNTATMKYNVENQMITREPTTGVTTSWLLQKGAFEEIIGQAVLKPGTYIWSIQNASGITINNPYIQLTTSSQEVITWKANTVIKLEEEVTISEIRSDSTWFKLGSVQQFQIQIEEGENVTQYAPYIKPQTYSIYLNEPLRKIGDAVDYIDFSTGKVYRNVGKEIYNENIAFTFTTGTYWHKDGVTTAFTCKKPANGIENNMGMLCLSNMFQYKKSSEINKNSPYISGNTDQMVIALKNETASTVEELKKFLGNNYSEIIYPLIEETTEDIGLSNISLKGVQNIIIDTTVIPSNIEIEY